MTGAPLVPVAIVGTEHSLAPGERAFRRTAVKIWVEKPLLWADYEAEPEPMVSMMADCTQRSMAGSSTGADQSGSSIVFRYRRGSSGVEQRTRNA